MALKEIEKYSQRRDNAKKPVDFLKILNMSKHWPSIEHDRRSRYLSQTHSGRNNPNNWKYIGDE
ncbi:uncharacterized protein G2W53_007383 [Senna tora]|uniref:Uncharacterized protein n=1 Tax=Senna tora TaxID=362788 RepID=A0A835CDL3_9FABA|nr:uncharacterized protein G2W53_007383 [Senna tora]